MNPIAREPVLVVVLAAIITWVGGRQGLKVDPQIATEAAAAVLIIGGVFARQLVRPTAKDDDTIELRKAVANLIAQVGQPPEPPEPPTSPGPGGGAVPSHVKITGMATGGVVTGGHPDPNATVDTGALTRRLVDVSRQRPRIG
jgi:hypothetical protein